MLADIARHDTTTMVGVICPSCQFAASVRHQPREFSLVPSGKSRPLVPAGPCFLMRGASRSSRTSSAGCDGRESAERRTAPFADGEVVWSWPLDAEVNSRQCFALRGDGDNKARSPGRARRKPLKPFARGKPALLAKPVVTCSCAFFCTRGCGCGWHPAFPAPSA
jgi:hypothetical protein